MSGVENSSRRDRSGGFKDLLWGLGVALSLIAVEVALGTLSGEAPAPSQGDRRAEYRRELRTYIVGFVLAILLTLVPYGLLYWSVLSRFGLLLAIGAFALVQGAVHLRCFLHINPPRQNTDDLDLVVFTSFVVFLMAGGTIWILGNLAARMH